MQRGVLQALNTPKRVIFIAIVPGQGCTQGKAKCSKKRYKKLIHFTTRRRYRYISETVEDRWVYTARRLNTDQH